jgi:hypothetical protein
MRAVASTEFSSKNGKLAYGAFDLRAELTTFREVGLIRRLTACKFAFVAVRFREQKGRFGLSQELG